MSPLLVSSLWATETLEARVLFATLLALVDSKGSWDGSLPALAKYAGLDIDEAREIVDRLGSSDSYEFHDEARVVFDEYGFLIPRIEKWFDAPVGRQPISAELREEIIARDLSICGICGGSVELLDIHIDHIHPVSKGGTNDPSNLQVAHSKCNLSKGAKL